MSESPRHLRCVLTTLRNGSAVEYLSQVHAFCFLLSYLAAFCGELYQLLRGRNTVARAVVLTFGVAGLVAHTAYLMNRSSESGLPPLVGSSHDWLLVLAWLGGLLYVLIIATRQKLAVGLFLLPVMVGLITAAMFVDDAAQDASRQLAAHRWGMLHASALVIGMGAVAAATICALMYLIQYQKLRGKSSFLHRLQLPSLEKLTAVSRWMVMSTVSMLTIGLLTGFILAAVKNESGAGMFRWSDPVVSGTTVVWGIMVAALCRIMTQKEQSGRQVARLTFMAGGFLLLTVLGLMLVSGGVHIGSGDSRTSAAFMRGGSHAG